MITILEQNMKLNVNYLKVISFILVTSLLIVSTRISGGDQ